MKPIPGEGTWGDLYFFDFWYDLVAIYWLGIYEEVKITDEFVNKKSPKIEDNEPIFKDFNVSGFIIPPKRAYISLTCFSVDLSMGRLDLSTSKGIIIIIAKFIAYITKELTNHTHEEILDLVEGIKGKKATYGESSSSTRIEETNEEIEEIKEESFLNDEDLKMEESIENEKQKEEVKELEENKVKNIVEDTINEKGIEEKNEEENMSVVKQG
uniref:Uncharacterized protein n=1 Tax=Meloidogyne javanica TaxID=6303 RepID=A0A915M0F8_MELJA